MSNEYCALQADLSHIILDYFCQCVSPIFVPIYLLRTQKWDRQIAYPTEVPLEEQF